MTAAEKEQLNVVAGHVWTANERLIQVVEDIERLSGSIPLTVELRRLQAEYHRWGVHEVKEVAGLN